MSSLCAPLTGAVKFKVVGIYDSLELSSFSRSFYDNVLTISSEIVVDCSLVMLQDF